MVNRLNHPKLPHGELSSCAELKDIVGACDHDMAKTHCPASCGKCDEAGAMDRASNRRGLAKCAR